MELVYHGRFRFLCNIGNRVSRNQILYEEDRPGGVLIQIQMTIRLL